MTAADIIQREIDRLKCRLFNRYHTPTGIFELSGRGGIVFMKFNHLAGVKYTREFHSLLKYENLEISRHGRLIERWVYTQPPLQNVSQNVNWRREGF